MPIDPGGEGDPHVKTFAGHDFEFSGRPGTRYNFLTYSRRGAKSLRVLPRIAAVAGDPSLTYIVGVDIHAGPVDLYLGLDGLVHVFHDGNHVQVQMKLCTLDAPGHGGCTTEEPHPLMGVPHCNLTLPAASVPKSATGLLVDGTAAADEADYRVEG